MIKNVILFFFAASTLLLASNEFIERGNTKYVSGRIVVKLSSDKLIDVNNFVNQASFLGIINSKKIIKNEFSGNEKKLQEISRIYIFDYSAPYDPLFISGKLKTYSSVEWAEPHYVREITFVPNDPKYLDNSQWFLDAIFSQQAWDVNKGSTDIVVAIIDTGVDWDHPELQNKIWTNPGEIPNNGIDDDGNGFIDDVRGWDFGSGDNDPMEDAAVHGTHVAGIVGAETNNGIGIASIGYNTSIMPVKITEGNSGSFPFPFGGIEYAVDNGADVINCSWRGFSYSRAEQAIVDYATLNGAAFVAAAGNDNTDQLAYPASYKNAFSVAGTQNGDVRYTASNYGTSVDVAAPAVGIYSTWFNDSYRSMSGTSMATPLTAGLVALVMNQFPTYNALQALEQVRVTSDNIDGINPFYQKKLGYGRINAHRALTETNKKSVRITSTRFVDKGNGNGVLEAGEDAEIELTFMNYLNPMSNLVITIETTNTDISFTNSEFIAGSAGTLNSFNNFSNKFSFTIAENIPQNSEVEFLISFNDGNYSDFEWLVERINPTYDVQNANDLAVTITSTGNLAFDDHSTSPQIGEGIRFLEGDNLCFEAAFMYGNSNTKLMDAAHIEYLATKSTDFESALPFNIKTPGLIADQEGRAVFNDNGAGVSKLGITTALTSYSFSDVPYSQFVVLRYSLFNNTGDDIQNLYAGLFFDWDIPGTESGQPWVEDVVGYDQTDKFGFVYDNSDQETQYAGVVLLSEQNRGFYAINNDGSNGSLNITGNFSDSQKWILISSGEARTQAGPDDISMVVSGGPVNIPAGEYVNFVFALCGAESLEELKSVVGYAKEKYNDIPTSVEQSNDVVPTEFILMQNYPNPFNPSTTIRFAIPSNVKNETPTTKLVVYDILGREIAALVNGNLSPGKYEVIFDGSNLSSGTYFYRIDVGDKYHSVKKMLLVK